MSSLKDNATIPPTEIVAACKNVKRRLICQVTNMAQLNEDAGAWAVELLEIEPNDSVLEIGFGPGVVMRHL